MELTNNGLLYQEFIREELSAVQLLETMIQYAHSLNTSDIHIDPSESQIIIRFRVDGVMRSIHKLPKSIYNSLFSRLKIISDLRIDEHTLPQDGRFSIESIGNISINVRVSIAPTYFGENAVLRLLSSDTAFALQDIGLSDPHIMLLKEIITNPFGLILITGPTGSGKTSTLYSLLKILNSNEQSLATIEEPIEYAMKGITQMQVNRQKGFGFAEGLKSILRQDPNVIGIGEIRDAETASLSIHAALTGHLVISTLHATSATAAIPRMTTMGIDPYLLSSTLTLVINQRLVRRLCAYCSIQKPLRESQINHLQKFIPVTSENMLYQYTANGCSVCSGTGVNGRTGIFEFLVLNNAMKEEITERVSVPILVHKAHSQGMKSLFEDAVTKALQGIISLDDVMNLIHA